MGKDEREEGHDRLVSRKFYLFPLPFREDGRSLSLRSSLWNHLTVNLLIINRVVDQDLLTKV